MLMLTRPRRFGEVLPSDLFHDWVDWTRPLGPVAEGMEAISPYPRLDVVDKDDAYEIKADLPGIKRDDVKIHVDGKDVEIAAEMSSEKKEEDGGKLLQVERVHGRFQRRLTLAEELDADRAKAAYEDGVLTLTLPKKRNGKRKLLKVN